MNIGLACNDANGNASTLRMVEFGQELMTLEGDIMDGEPINFVIGKLMIGQPMAIMLHYRNHQRYVGNICWDQVEMEPAEVARLVNFLRTLPHWTCAVGSTPLFEKWGAGGTFTAEDFES